MTDIKEAREFAKTLNEQIQSIVDEKYIEFSSKYPELRLRILGDSNHFLSTVKERTPEVNVYISLP